MNRKTILLLLAFVLVPLMIGGWIVLDRMNQQANIAERSSAMQRLQHVSDKVVEQLAMVKRISDTLSYHEAINDVVLKDTGSLKHYESNQEMKSVLEYNDYVIKIQLLTSGKVIWQYGDNQRFVFGEEGNEQYAAMIDKHDKAAFWSPAHPLLQLRRGRFDEDVWVVSYYSGIYETQNMQQNGVLALHIAEESICDTYWSSLYGNPLEAWVVMDEGEIFSATQKEWLTEGLPEELQITAEKGPEGATTAQFQGKEVQLLWAKCGDLGFYLVQMNEKNSILGTYVLMIAFVVILLLFMSVGYIHFHKIYITGPLEALTLQMERAKNLDLRQESLPAQGDEIGALASTFQGMLAHIDELIGKVYVEKIKTQEAEQELMLSQINPHFLYNTLDSIRWNALSHGDKEVAKQMEALSLVLRNTLNFGKLDTTVGQEVQTIENYCYLLQARFRKDIEVEIDVHPMVKDYHIPKLLIQPLVENAYTHGLENKSGFKKIWIKVKKLHGKIVIYVADNGVGCDKGQILLRMETDAGTECFALKNIRDRLRLAYGNEGRFRFSSKKGTGTIVKLILPLNSAESE